MQLSLHAHVCTHVMCLLACTCVCMCVCYVPARMCACLHVCACVHARMCAHLCACTCTLVCLHTCVCLHAHARSKKINCLTCITFPCIRAANCPVASYSATEFTMFGGPNILDPHKFRAANCPVASYSTSWLAHLFRAKNIKTLHLSFCCDRFSCTFGLDSFFVAIGLAAPSC